jgi:cell wall-associated NlpC family hydrolase
MFTGEDVVRIARTYKGTPWVQTGRIKGKEGGVDCIGLVICVFNELGLNIPSTEQYSMEDEFALLKKRVEERCILVENKQLLPGDIMLFRARLMHNHAAIYSGEKTIIHAYNSEAVRMVVEDPYTASWGVRLFGTYRVRELA